MTSPSNWRVRTGALLAATGLVLSGCTDGLAFREDRRVVLQSPDYREKVSFPVTIDWEVTDELAADLADEGAPPAGFAVLVDRAPMPPGQSLRWFFEEDECPADDGCPDAEDLADERVFTTRGTEFTFDRLRPAPGVDLDRGDRDIHEVTVILLDERGRRVDESAWTFTFEIEGSA